MSSFTKKILSVVLSLLMLLFALPLSASAVSSDKAVGSLRLESYENEEEQIVVDIYINNLTKFYKADIEYDYQSYGLEAVDYDLMPYNADEAYFSYGCSGSYGSNRMSVTSNDIVFYEAADVLVARLVFERVENSFVKTADIDITADVYLEPDELYCTDSDTVSVKLSSTVTVTPDATPGSIKVEYEKNEDGQYVVDLYILNVADLYCVEVDTDYNSERIRKYSTETMFFYGWNWYSGADTIYTELELSERADIHLLRIYFESVEAVLYTGADIKFTTKAYFGDEAYENEEVSYEDSASISIPAEKLDPEKFPNALQSGDVDGDGTITASDARLALRLSVDLDRGVGLVDRYADVDTDGEVTASDARTLLRVSVSLENPEELPYFLPAETSSDDGDYYWGYKDVTDEEMYEGETKNLGNVIIRKGTQYSWSSSNPDVATVSENGTVSAKKKGFACIILTVGEDKFYYDVTVKSTLQQKIEALKDKYPDGYYWNNFTPSTKYPNVTETPCTDHATGAYKYCKGQCAGFAALLYGEVFPNAKKTTGVTWNTVKIGDYVRLKPNHSVFITDVVRKGDIIGYDHYEEKNYVSEYNYVMVAHCNWHCNCDIQWDYMLDMESYELFPELSYTAY